MLVSCKYSAVNEHSFVFSSLNGQVVVLVVVIFYLFFRSGLEMGFWVTHTGVILARDDGGKPPPPFFFFLRCGPAWYGWLILPRRCHRRGRKSCSRVRGNWLTDGTLWREACEVRLSPCPHPLPSRAGVSVRSHHVNYILLCMSICASLAFLAQNCDWNCTKYAVCYWYSMLESHFLAKLFSHSLYREKKLKPWMMFFSLYFLTI